MEGCALPKPVSGRPGVYRFEPRNTSLSSESPKPPDDNLWLDLVDAAKALGLTRLGVTPADAFHSVEPVLARWLAAGFHGDMRFMTGASRSDPRELLPEAKSVLVVAAACSRFEHSDAAPAKATSGKVASYALGQDYHQWDPLESTCRHASLSIL